MRSINVEVNQTNSLETMKERAVEYFQHLYACNKREEPLQNMNLNFDDVIPLEVVAWMRRYPRIDEIKEVLFSMPKAEAHCKKSRQS